MLVGCTQPLDYILDVLYDGKTVVLEPTVRAVLRVSLFETLILGTLPHAAVHEAVAACRALRWPRAAGLVNALLRKAGRAAAKGALPEPPLPAAGEALVAALGVRHSILDWIVLGWVPRFGADDAQLA